MSPPTTVCTRLVDNVLEIMIIYILWVPHKRGQPGLMSGTTNEIEMSFFVGQQSYQTLAGHCVMAEGDKEVIQYPSGAATTAANSNSDVIGDVHCLS